MWASLLFDGTLMKVVTIWILDHLVGFNTHVINTPFYYDLNGCITVRPTTTWWATSSAPSDRAEWRLTVLSG